MIEDAADGTAPDPKDGDNAGTLRPSGVPAADAQPAGPIGTAPERDRGTPQWLEAATELLDRDVATGLMDTDRLLEVVSWQVRQLFSHAKTDRAHHSKATLLEQIRATQALINTATAVQHVRVAQYAATAESEDPELEFDSDATGQERVREHAHPLGHVCEFTDVDLAPAMCWGPFQAVRRIDDAVDAVVKTPRLLDEMGAGRLDAARVAQVTGELIEAGDATCAQVEDRMLEEGVGSWTTRQARNRARTLVRRLDPAAARQSKTKQMKDEIGSFTRPGPINGLTEWNLVLPTEQALPAVQAVEDLARQLHQDQIGDKTLGQWRVDALCDLLLGHAEVATTVTVLVPVKTTTTAINPGRNDTSPVLAGGGTDRNHDGNGGRRTGSSTHGGRGGWPVPQGSVEAMLTDTDWDAALQRLVVDLEHTDHFPKDPPACDAGIRIDPDAVDSRSDPACDPPPNGSPLGLRRGMCLPDIEVPGLGVIPADAIQEMLRTLGTRLTRSLVDWRTGTLIETCCDAYRPTAAIRRHVLQRDMHCRFPGCQRPARFCDVDHVTAWPLGATEVSNLQCLCKHHHRAKHETHWAVTMTPDGTCTWTSPTGRTYTTYPGSLDVTADLRVTPGPPETAPAPGHVDPRADSNQ